MPECAIVSVGVFGIMPISLCADLAANPQTGLSARDEEIAVAVRVTDADVFQRFRLGGDNPASAARAPDVAVSTAAETMRKLLKIMVTPHSQKGSQRPDIHADHPCVWARKSMASVPSWTLRT